MRVTRQRYYVYPRPQQNIYRPKDKVTVDIKALDANNQPVQTEGTVKVTRDYWWEVWLDPAGREVKGEELRQLREKSEAFPPPVNTTSVANDHGDSSFADTSTTTFLTHDS